MLWDWKFWSSTHYWCPEILIWLSHLTRGRMIKRKVSGPVLHAFWRSGTPKAPKAWPYNSEQRWWNQSALATGYFPFRECSWCLNSSIKHNKLSVIYFSSDVVRNNIGKANNKTMAGWVFKHTILNIEYEVIAKNQKTPASPVFPLKPWRNPSRSSACIWRADWSIPLGPEVQGQYSRQASFFKQSIVSKYWRVSWG